MLRFLFFLVGQARGMLENFLCVVDALVRKKEEEDENEKKDSATRVSLPLEMISEILTRLPVKSLLRFKCVCNEWLSLIESDSFVSEHWMRSSPTLINDLSSEVVDEDGLKPIGQCQGLLLEKNAETGELRIRNPATRQVLDLPDPGWGGTSYEFLFYLECSSTFKVVSYRYEVDQLIGWQVLSIGTGALTWKNCKPPFEYRVISTSSRGPMVYPLAMSIIDCLGRIFSNGELLDEIQVRSFDLITDELRQTCVPRDFWANVAREAVHHGKWNNDRIAYAHVAEEKLHITVLEDFRTATWSSEKMVVPLDFLKKHHNWEMVTSSTIWFNCLEGDSLRLSSTQKKSTLSYNLKTKEVVEIESEPVPVPVDKVRPTLRRLEGMYPQLAPLKGDEDLPVHSLDHAVAGDQ